MSDLAEYARRLHETDRRSYERVITPSQCQYAHEALKGVRAAIFDVYGTLVNYWRPEFESWEGHEGLLLDAFSEVSALFGMDDTLGKMNPDDSPARTLNDLYNGLIVMKHQQFANNGGAITEALRIEEIWAVIVLMLKRNGYDADKYAPGNAEEFARYLAYTYNFFSMGRELYPGVADALKKLKDDNIVLGILSDAQLYTPIDLTLLLREQSGGKIDDYNELFDTDLTFLSCEYGFAKPSDVLFRRLFDALYEYHITPAQTLFVGNDLSIDIKPAAALGMRTALFCGDDIMIFGAGADVVPDIIFNKWEELPGKAGFHGEMEP